MKEKLKYWIWRYLPAEIIGTITALICAITANTLTGSALISSFAGTWGENIGYYGFFFFQEFRNSTISHQEKNKKYDLISCLINIRDLAIEFGLPEWLDSSTIRPFLMFLLPKVVNNFALGIILGKLAADVVFYIGVIIAHEIRKNYLKRV